MGKNDEKTRDRLRKLSKSIGKIDINHDDVDVKPKIIYSSAFKTSEIVFLIILTSVISLFIGGLAVYKFNENGGKYLDKELQEIITNYEYINKNYYGKIDKSKLTRSAIEGMLGTLDVHSAYVGDDDSEFNTQLEGKYKGIGVQVYNDENNKIIVSSVFKGSPADKAGLQAGDILLKVNDKSLDGKSTSEASSLIKSQKSEFSITYKRGEEEIKCTIKLSFVDLISVDSEIIKRDDKKVGYMYISIFADNTYKQFKKELGSLEKKGIDSLIIDIRENNGGHLTAAEDILSLFLSSSHPIYQIKGTDGNHKYYSKGKKDKKYKIVLLVNSSSASASELTTSALKEQYGATVVGLKTYGKGTIQEIQDLSDGGHYKLTTKMWLTSKGKKVDGKGIKPDVEVKLDDKYREEPTMENDNQLNKAIEEAIK